MSVRELQSATRESPVRLGRYDVVAQIGRGGMGHVYEAEDVEHGTRVALKTLKHLDPDRILQFKREFRQVADLRHPNLVRLYELGCEGELWFFTMEFLEGEDFVASLGAPLPEHASSREEPMPPTGSTWAETVTLLGSEASDMRRETYFEEPRQLDAASVVTLRKSMRQLVAALQAVHEAGLLHLDIKPSNILVQPDGRVVLLDFGIARAPTQASAYEDLRGKRDEGPTRRVTGTPAWMSPEQHDGVTLSPATDWYAVGLVLYTALTGMRAFSVEGTSALAYAKKNTQPIAPHQLVDVPADLSTLCMDLMHPDPEARPSGEELVAFFAEDGERPVARRARKGGLVGRTKEREVLTDALECALDRQSRVVLLSGPSGIGKSALLEDLYESASRSDAMVLQGRCYERETVPYKAFDGMLDELARKLAGRSNEELDRYLPPWIQELARVFPVLGGVRGIAGVLAMRPPLPRSLPGAEIQRRAVEALRELMAALARHRGCVLTIDDLQWADADSCHALERLLASPVPAGLMVVLAYREHEINENPRALELLERIRREAQDQDATSTLAAHSISLGPLTGEDAALLAARALGKSDAESELLASIAQVAEGKPFFIEELAHLAAGQLDAGEAPTLEMADLTRRRVATLVDEERRLVECLAVAGSPIPVTSAVSAVGFGDRGVMSALWSLRRADFVRVGAGTSVAQPTIALRHDRLRESVTASLSETERRAYHRALGKDLSTRGEAYVFDATRHLNIVGDALEPKWRERAAQLNLVAGRRARRGAAFDLAYQQFSAALRLLGAEPWVANYEVALAAHEGAADAAYLSARWDAVQEHVEAIKTKARTPVEMLRAWEAEIDSAIARNAFIEAVDAGVQAIEGLGSGLPANPSQDEIGAEFQAAMGRLSEIGVDGVDALPIADDAVHQASMRVHSRITSAAYFGRPNLLPVIACRMVVASVERGLVPATPYALSILGIVLNTVSMHEAAHAWGQAALKMMERFDDRSLDARTGHVVHDLVCNWVVHLADTLDDVWGVYQVGKSLGDVEYASYAAHAYVHQALYVARPLEPLLEKAEEISAFMQGYDQVNALHVHEPFEQILRALLGQKADPAVLDGHGFFEAESIAAAEAAGSRSALCLNRVVMGYARYTFNRYEEASAIFEAARPYLDGMPSVWHTPLFHQYSALSILGLEAEQREPLMQHVDTAIAALKVVAEAGPMNFAHRVELVEAERARVQGRLDEALEFAGRAIAGAREHGWLNDLGIALQVVEKVHRAREESTLADEAREQARQTYAAWGARAKVEQLS